MVTRERELWAWCGKYIYVVVNITTKLSAVFTFLYVLLTLSLLRVINVKFPLQPHKKYDITQYGELDFS